MKEIKRREVQKEITIPQKTSFADPTPLTFRTSFGK